MESIEKLRKYMLCDKGEKFTAYINADELADEIEREIAEKHIELPVDADGVPIHVGDVLEYDYGDDVRGTRIVCALIYDGTRSKEFDGGIWDFEFDDDYEGDSRNVHCMSDFYECNRHVKPDPLKELLNDHLQEREKIVRKLESSLITLGEAESEEDACDKLFAERIRELLGGERR